MQTVNKQGYSIEMSTEVTNVIIFVLVTIGRDERNKIKYQHIVYVT